MFLCSLLDENGVQDAPMTRTEDELHVLKDFTKI
jgi:hypothetical protein